MRISVIIPIYKEPPEVLEALLGFIADTNDKDLEWIITTTTDSQIEHSNQHRHLKIITGERGRAKQMNTGAKQASGEFLVFLHSDTLLESGWLEELRKHIASDISSWGAFRPAINGTEIIYELAQTWGAWRSKTLGYPYGDQTIFINRKLFEEVGRYDESTDFMEELVLARRLGKKGLKPKMLNSQAFTSPRRWQKHGKLRYSMGNLILFGLFISGISPSFLKRLANRFIFK